MGETGPACPGHDRSRIDYLGHMLVPALASKATKKFDPRRKKPDAMPRPVRISGRHHHMARLYMSAWQWGGEDHITAGTSDSAEPAGSEDGMAAVPGRVDLGFVRRAQAGPG